MSHFDTIDSALRNKGRVLDVGCNTREFFQEMKDTYSIGEIVGVDVMPSEGIICANLATDDIDIGQFDAIMSHDLFIAFWPAEKRRMLERFRSMLKPGGYIVINDFNSSIFWGNALANYYRRQWWRTAMFLWAGLLHHVFWRKNWRAYHFVSRRFYENIGLGMPVVYVENAGNFNRTEASAWFLRKASERVKFRDLIVFGPLSGLSPVEFFNEDLTGRA